MEPGGGAGRTEQDKDGRRRPASETHPQQRKSRKKAAVGQRSGHSRREGHKPQDTTTTTRPMGTAAAQAGVDACTQPSPKKRGFPGGLASPCTNFTTCQADSSIADESSLHSRRVRRFPLGERSPPCACRQSTGLGGNQPVKSLAERTKPPPDRKKNHCGTAWQDPATMKIPKKGIQSCTGDPSGASVPICH